MSKRYAASTHNLKPGGTILPVIEGPTHEEGLTTEAVVYNPRGNLGPNSRVSSARPLFSNYNAKTFKKNVNHVNNLVHNYVGTNYHKSPE